MCLGLGSRCCHTFHPAECKSMKICSRASKLQRCAHTDSSWYRLVNTYPLSRFQACGFSYQYWHRAQTSVWLHHPLLCLLGRLHRSSRPMHCNPLSLIQSSHSWPFEYRFEYRLPEDFESCFSHLGFGRPQNQGFCPSMISGSQFHRYAWPHHSHHCIHPGYLFDQVLEAPSRGCWAPGQVFPVWLLVGSDHRKDDLRYHRLMPSRRLEGRAERALAWRLRSLTAGRIHRQCLHWHYPH